MRPGPGDGDRSDDEVPRTASMYPDTPPGGVPTTPAAEEAYHSGARRIPMNQVTRSRSILGYQRAINGTDMDHSGIFRYEWKMACLLTGDCEEQELEEF